MPCLNNIPPELELQIQHREKTDSLRRLSDSVSGIDFYSNDYLGLAQNKNLFEQAHQYLKQHKLLQNGSTGSRLLSGNHPLFTELEIELCQIHQSESATIFNSGYDANLGLLSSLPQRSDVVLFDKLCHASIRDGLQLSKAKSYAFDHNDLKSLENKLIKHPNKNIYVVTESVFSMDGDQADLPALIQLCEKFQARLIVDEAHAVGVFGYGLIQKYNLQDSVFARVITFGKALGCHGATILGSHQLKIYLINFARSFIYTTALPPSALAHIKLAYVYLNKQPQIDLMNHIQYFKQLIEQLDLKHLFIESESAIQSCIIPGNQKVKSIALKLQQNNFAIKAILSPTVPKGQERLRFCLHSYNTKEQINSVLKLLTQLLKSDEI